MKQNIALFPGSFKLFHPGHLHLINQYIDNVDKLIIIISNKERDMITGDHALEWIKLVLENYADEGKIEVVISNFPSPVTHAFDYIKHNPGNYIWIQSNKDNEQGIIDRLHKLYEKENILVNISNLSISHQPLLDNKNEIYNGTYIRSLISNNKYDEIISLYENIDNEDELLEFLTTNFKEDIKIPFTKHLNHIYEQEDLTFQDLIKIINLFSTSGEFTEKIDGINMKISFKNNQFICARNKSQLKNFGENSYYSGIKSIYNDVLNDLNSRINSDYVNFYNNLFNSGKYWINLDILDINYTNVISYLDRNDIFYFKRSLMIHNILESDIDGNLYYHNYGDLNKLAYYLNSTNHKNDNPYITSVTKQLKYVQSRDFQEYSLNLINELKTLCNNNLNLTIREYNINLFKCLVRILTHLDIDDATYNLIYDRIINKDTSYHLKNYDKEIISLIKYLEKKISKHNIIKDLDMIFIKFGNKILHHIEYNNDNIPVSSYIYNRILKDTANILKSNNEADIIKLKYNLDRLKDIKYDINLFEGIIIDYKDYKLKLTGSFGPVNQILGILKFKKC